VRAAYDQVELVQTLLRRDHRSEARHVAATSPIIETAAEETATVPAAGDYSDELARIERERERIERGG
jgi:hypothetical protein